jgi:hypothetical protein
MQLPEYKYDLNDDITITAIKTEPISCITKGKHNKKYIHLFALRAGLYIRNVSSAPDISNNERSRARRRQTYRPGQAG